MSKNRTIKNIFYIVICVLIAYITLKPKTEVTDLVKHPNIDVEILIEGEDQEQEYLNLEEMDFISGTIKGFIHSDSSQEKYAYIEYKINDAYHAPAYSPSYSLEIDTTKLPNGINKLLIIGYEEVNEVRGTKEILLNVDNGNNLVSRAPRRSRFYKIEDKPLYKKNYIPVLMYHDFQEDITLEQESAVVHPQLFEEQIQMLLQCEYTPITFYDLYLYSIGEGGLPLKPVIITADDGYLSNYETAFPILKKYNIPATYFITTQYIGTTTMYPHFTWENAKEMEESGLIDIQSHTHSHLLMSKLSKDEVLYQALISFGLIEQKLGERDVKVLSYPQFYNNKKTRKLLEEAGIDLQVTNLAKRYFSKTQCTDVKRIHVGNFTTPELLIEEIKKVTE